MTDQPPPADPQLFRDPDKVVSDLRLLGKCRAFSIPETVEQRALFHIVRILTGKPIKEGGLPPRPREIQAAIDALYKMKRYNLDLAKAEAGMGLDKLKDRIAMALQVNVNLPTPEGKHDDLVARTIAQLDAIISPRTDAGGDRARPQLESEAEGPGGDDQGSPFDAD